MVGGVRNAEAANDDMSWDVAGRIKALEQFTGSLVPRRAGTEAEADEIPINEAPPTGSRSRASRGSSCAGPTASAPTPTSR